MSIVKLTHTTGLFAIRDPWHVGIAYSPPKVHNRHHKTAPDDAVYIGRGSPWGNPYVIGIHGSREEVIELYRIHTLPQLDLTQLKGKHLVCFCKPAACHGDLLLAAANQ
jgi:hypothetical protein